MRRKKYITPGWEIICMRLDIICGSLTQPTDGAVIIDDGSELGAKPFNGWNDSDGDDELFFPNLDDIWQE